MCNSGSTSLKEIVNDIKFDLYYIRATLRDCLIVTDRSAEERCHIEESLKKINFLLEKGDDE